LDIGAMIVYKDVQDAVGKPLIGVQGYVTSYLPPSETNDAFKERYKTKFGFDLPLTTPPSTYDSILIWAQAVEAVGDPTKYKEISDYIKTHPYQGLSGAYDFNNSGQTVLYGPDFPIGYAQYAGDHKLLFYGVDDFFLPPWIQPPWPEAQ
jgi:ABC-type branched-subunit amino acid transport system substrate-binding protein